jgi:hypothetical protein
VGKSTLNTMSYYMTEFRDDVNEKWIMGFCDFKDKGFPDNSWNNYIEKMIRMEKQQVEVLMKCSKAVLRAKRIADGANVYMQYFHDVGKLEKGPSTSESTFLSSLAFFVLLNEMLICLCDTFIVITNVTQYHDTFFTSTHNCQ